MKQHEPKRDEQSEDANSWSAPAVAFLCTFFLLLGAACYKWILSIWL